jgi:hypothetical protein
MALTLTPVTELDAINMMLMSIGQSPVNTVTSTGIKDVAVAQLILHNTSRSIQSEGWAFNTDYALDITPDGNDRILVPSNALHIDPVNPGEDFVQRYDLANTAMSMYDLIDQTFDRTTDLSVDIIYFYEFEQIPQTARDYIALSAGQIFQAQAVSSELLFRFEEKDINKAQVRLMRSQSRVKDRNILNGTDFTNQIFHRRFNPRF